MKGALPLKNKEKFTVLVAPLDWGLGHASRCIPLIHALISAGASVWLAAEGQTEALLRLEFPQLPCLPLNGYGIQYARKKSGMSWTLLWQARKIKTAIKNEQEWLRSMQEKYEFDAVISDNRYGLHHPGLISIIITHQLRIKTGMGKWTENILQRWNYQYLEQFDQCWIPDTWKDNGLAGELSHPEKMPAIPVKFIGPLSRMERTGDPVRKNKLLVIISGPEPQRTLLEEKIFGTIAHYNGEATILRGLPAARTHVPSTGMINIYNHLDAASLAKEMNEAEFVIARSGYSTVMDALSLGKKCIFIPTPGQTEQEYLGRYLQQKKLALCIGQDSFDLEKALEQARAFPYAPAIIGPARLSEAIDSIKEGKIKV